MTHEEIVQKFSELFKELVPDMGKADTVGGEIVRAYNRIAYREYNDGDHIGVGYGNETCNPAARYLAAKCGPEVDNLIFTQMWGVCDDAVYDNLLNELGEKVLDFYYENSREMSRRNDEDMYDYRDMDEDVETYDDEEDEDYGWA